MENLYIEPFNIENIDKKSIEYSLGKEIIKDLFIEFALNKNNDFERHQLLETKGKLLEERCLIPNFKQYIDTYWKYLLGGFERNLNAFKNVNNIFGNIPNVFFEDLFLKIEYIPNTKYYSAYYVPKYG